jgi:DNA-binding PadR family transcriptional regulator
LSSERLNPFSYVILVLVGQGGAGPHDLRRAAERGRFYWEAAPSQWYAEPKRLARLGYLEAHKERGRTRERTRYTLTPRGREAIAEWVRTPVPLPRMQHETIVRLLAADLVDPAAVAAGLPALRVEVEAALERLEAARPDWRELPQRERYLEINARYAERLLRLQLEWLDEALEALG